MYEPIDYSPLDHPLMSQTMFYPQRVWSTPPSGATDHLIPVDTGVSVSARFYPLEPESPNVLFFHGNGEVACQYDTLVPSYHRAGMSFFVADFRGYGQSSGIPTFSTMTSDAAEVFLYYKRLLESEGFSGSIFVKGRSMGCHSALEVTARFQDELAGLIMESGSASIGRTIERWGLPPDEPVIAEMLRLHEEKVRSVALPLLVIHGERDDLILVERAVEFFGSVSSKDKAIEIIPMAGHNDLLLRGREQYFEAMRKFVQDHA